MRSAISHLESSKDIRCDNLAYLTFMYVCMYVCMYVYVYICMYVCMYDNIYVYLLSVWCMYESCLRYVHEWCLRMYVTNFMYAYAQCMYVCIIGMSTSE